jgi:hypothetical protein
MIVKGIAFQKYVSRLDVSWERWAYKCKESTKKKLILNITNKIRNRDDQIKIIYLSFSLMGSATSHLTTLFNYLAHNKTWTANAKDLGHFQKKSSKVDDIIIIYKVRDKVHLVASSSLFLVESSTSEGKNRKESILGSVNFRPIKIQKVLKYSHSAFLSHFRQKIKNKLPNNLNRPRGVLKLREKRALDKRCERRKAS